MKEYQYKRFLGNDEEIVCQDTYHRNTQLLGAFSQNLLHNYNVKISESKINLGEFSEVSLAAVFCLLLRNVYIMKKPPMKVSTRMQA